MQELCVDYGHWEQPYNIDLNQYLAFTYMITLKSGKKYIGAKKIWRKITKAPCEFKKQDNFKQSNWKNYTSSQNAVNRLIADGDTIDKAEIIQFHTQWGTALLAEMKLQLEFDVLRDPLFLNAQIGGRMNKGCFDNMTDIEIEEFLSLPRDMKHVHWRYMFKPGCKYKRVPPEEEDMYLLNGWQYGHNFKPEYEAEVIRCQYYLYNKKEDKIYFVENQGKFAKKYKLCPGHLTRLVQGELDHLNNEWTVLPEYTRRDDFIEHIETGMKFKQYTEADVYFYNKKRGMSQYYTQNAKNKLFRLLDVETREEHIQKLKDVEYVKKVKQLIKFNQSDNL